MLKKFPKAFAKEGLMSGNWYVYAPAGVVIGLASSAKAAWEAAAGFVQQHYGA